MDDEVKLPTADDSDAGTVSDASATAPVTAPVPTGKAKPSKAKKPAAEPTPAAETTDEQEAPEPAPASPLPLFNVLSNGLESKAFHAVDESDAVRQFYIHHKITDTASRNHSVQRIS